MKKPERFVWRVKNSADGILKYFFLFSPENEFWHFMQIVSSGDNLHKLSKPIFYKKKKKK